MCTVVLLKDVVEGMPVLLAANRDEFFDRPAAGPGMLDPALGIVGGRDLQAGGTWLAVSASGFFVALTNLRGDDRTDIGPLQSRGHVVLEVARAGARGGLEAARAWLEAADPQATQPYHLLFGDRHTVYVARVQRTLTLAEVPAGIHVLPNGALNDARFPKVDRIRRQLAPVPRQWPAMRAAVWSTLADDTIPEDAPTLPEAPFPTEVQAALHAVWVRLPMYGSRSSSMVGIFDDGSMHYACIDGPPSGEPVDHTHLLNARGAWPDWADRDALWALTGGLSPEVDWIVRYRQMPSGHIDTVQVAAVGPVTLDVVQSLLSTLDVDARLLRRASALIPPGRCRLGLALRWTAQGLESVRVRFGDLPDHFEGVQGPRRLQALATMVQVALPGELTRLGGARAAVLHLHPKAQGALSVERVVEDDDALEAFGWGSGAVEVRHLLPTDGRLVGCEQRGPALSPVAAVEWWSSEPTRPGIEEDGTGTVVARWLHGAWPCRSTGTA